MKKNLKKNMLLAYIKNQLKKKFLLFIIKIDEGVEVINLVVGSAEFEGQRRGAGSQGFLGQNRLHLSLDC